MYLMDHVEMRMLERGITRRQVFNVLRRGELIDGIEWCTKKESGWKCKINTLTAGVSVSVVPKLVSRPDGEVVLVITAFEVF